MLLLAMHLSQREWCMILGFWFLWCMAAWLPVVNGIACGSCRGNHYSKCHGQTYDMKLEQCFGNRTLCLFPMALCGSTCYDPSWQICRDDLPLNCDGHTTIVLPQLQGRPLQCTSNGATSDCPPNHPCCDLSIYGQPNFRCINRAVESCCVSQLGDNFVCPRLRDGRRAACCQQRLAAICYDPQTSFCCSIPAEGGGFSKVCRFADRKCCRSINSPVIVPS